MGFYEYKVIIWNRVGEREELELGVCYAEDYLSAMEKVTNYYGDELIKVTLYALEPMSCYVLEGPSRGEFFDGHDD